MNDSFTAVGVAKNDREKKQVYFWCQTAKKTHYKEPFSVLKILSVPVVTLHKNDFQTLQSTHCLKISRNVSFEFFNLGIFQQFLSY